MHPEVTIYQQQVFQAQRILNKISHRKAEELERQRSQGYYLTEDLKDRLRGQYFRHKTQPLSKKIKKIAMQRTISASMQQFSDHSLPQGPSITRHSTVQQKIGCLGDELELAEEMRQRKTKRLTKLLNTMTKSLQKGNPFEGQQSQQREQDKTLEQYNQGKAFLPMLELYISERASASKVQNKVQSIITQMMLLALARRKNNQLLNGLDILIEIEEYFPRSLDCKLLKSVWYQFITKMYLETKQQFSKQKKNRWVQQKQRTVNRSQKGRQRSVMIRNLVSRRNFIERVSLQVKTLGLINETTYCRQARDYSNSIQQFGSRKVVVSRITQNYVISYPDPSELFWRMIDNYGVVAVSRDSESSLFPYHFPPSMNVVMPPSEYLAGICKVNSKLLPSKSSICFQRFISKHFEVLLGISLCLLLEVILLLSLKGNSFLSLSISGLFVLLMFLLLLRLNLTFKPDSLPYCAAIYTSVDKVLQEWVDGYKEQGLKATITEGVDLILFSFPKEYEEDFIESENQMIDCNFERTRNHKQTALKGVSSYHSDLVNEF